MHQLSRPHVSRWMRCAQSIVDNLKFEDEGAGFWVVLGRARVYRSWTTESITGNAERLRIIGELYGANEGSSTDKEREYYGIELTQPS